LVRTVRRFVDEEERVAGRSPAPLRPASTMTKERHQESAAAQETKPEAPVTYQLSEQPSPLVQEEEFAKQLRLARYLTGASLQPSRPLEAVIKARAPKQERTVTKAGSKAKAEPAKQKAGEAELAKERRRAGKRSRQRLSSSGRQQNEKHRGSLER
jgi:hypothetical protein